jgi:hypothetical protein
MEPYSKYYRLLRAQAGNPVPEMGWCARSRLNGRYYYEADPSMTELTYTEVMLYAKVYPLREEAIKAQPNMEIVSFSCLSVD